MDSNFANSFSKDELDPTKPGKYIHFYEWVSEDYWNALLNYILNDNTHDDLLGPRREDLGSSLPPWYEYDRARIPTPSQNIPWVFI